jgi:predicted  nucleic acid-binding Zn-ribbon protein
MQQAKGELEEEIIRIMQEVDSIKGQIEVREADIAITEEDWNKKHQQLKEQIHSIDKALSQAAVRRQASLLK